MRSRFPIRVLGSTAALLALFPARRPAEARGSLTQTDVELIPRTAAAATGIGLPVSMTPGGDRKNSEGLARTPDSLVARHASGEDVKALLRGVDGLFAQLGDPAAYDAARFANSPGGLARDVR